MGNAQRKADREAAAIAAASIPPPDPRVAELERELRRDAGTTPHHQPVMATGEYGHLHCGAEAVGAKARLSNGYFYHPSLPDDVSLESKSAADDLRARLPADQLLYVKKANDARIHYVVGRAGAAAAAKSSAE